MKAVVKRPAYTLIEVLVVVGIIAVLIGLISTAIQSARVVAARTQCQNNLKQCALALHQFHDVQTVLPAGVSHQDGKARYPFMSWHVRILPFLDQGPLWLQAEAAYTLTPDFNQSPPHPSKSIVPTYSCPSDPRMVTGSKFGNGFTSYLGVEGTNQFRRDGMLFLDSQVSFLHVKDGASNTLLIGERPPSADHRLGWWYAGWGQEKTGSAEMVLGVTEHAVGKWTKDCPPGPYPFGPGSFDNQCDAFHFWSPHPGGANFCFADGSVRFLTYAAAPIMPALATRAGNETATVID